MASHRGGSIRDVGLEGTDIKTAPLVCREVVSISEKVVSSGNLSKEIVEPIRSFHRAFQIYVRITVFSFAPIISFPCPGAQVAPASDHPRSTASQTI